jgi:hypothetical protein
MPRIARRVVCGRLLVIATLLPTRAFMSVDLPTFGRPAKHANPDLKSAAARRVPPYAAWSDAVGAAGVRTAAELDELVIWPEVCRSYP